MPRRTAKMNPPARKIPAAKKAVHASGGAGEYPKATNGSKMAREMREKGNKLTSTQRDELLDAAMGMIYGGTVAPEKAGA
jgi:hypothetical protein